MQKFHVKKGDEVVVIAGSDKGKRGKIIEMFRAKNRAIVEGVKMIKRHTRKSQQNPQGAIIEREGTVHISNLMVASNFVTFLNVKFLHSFQMTSGASEMIFMNFFSRSSRATGPKMRVPRGLCSLSMMTIALASKRR